MRIFIGITFQSTHYHYFIYINAFEEVRPELIERGWTRKENPDQVEEALYRCNHKKGPGDRRNKKK